MKSTRMPKLVNLISQKGYTAVELCELLHCTIRSSRDMIQRLRAEGNVHIQSWRKTSVTQWSAVYRYGIGVDADKPEPVSSSSRLRKHRSKEDADTKERRLAKQRQLKRKVKRDPLTAAFYGDV
jgi:hypothetical protein